jgi:hypothetical protein
LRYVVIVDDGVRRQPSILAQGPGQVAKRHIVPASLSRGKERQQQRDYRDGYVEALFHPIQIYCLRFLANHFAASSSPETRHPRQQELS